MPIESVNPATGQTVETYEEMPPEEVSHIIDRTHRAFREWRRLDYGERAGPLRAAARILREQREDLARLMAEEMGKPVSQGRAEAEKCAWVCEYYAENGEAFLADEAIKTDASRSFVTFQPLGVVLAVMPWNFPFWQVFRFAAPALMAGNTAVLKHASNVPGCALAIEDIFQRAGFPHDVFRTLLVGSGQVDAIIEHPHVQAVTLTGSEPAGRAVGRKAGEMLKKTVLELGGSDPYLLLEDADLDKAVQTCAYSRLLNAGQSCISAKRFIVVEAIRTEFELRFRAALDARRVGDPMEEDVDLGPLARVDLRDELHEQVRRSVELGAQCLLGGEIPDRQIGRAHV